jgi:hypothetical protein
MKEQNEIDIIELYQKILVFIFNKRWILLLFIGIGIVLGLGLYLKKSSEIKTNFLAESKDVSKEVIYSLTDKIAFEIEKRDYEALKSELNLDIDILEQIREFGIDTSGQILNISIVSTTKDALIPFTLAMVNYINNQPFILESLKTKKEQVEKLVQKIDEEIENISLFQKQFLEDNKTGQVTINQLNGSHSEKINLYKMRQSYEEVLKQKNAVSIINKGDNSIRKENSLIVYLSVSILLSIFFAVVFFFVQFSIQLKNKA